MLLSRLSPIMKAILCFPMPSISFQNFHLFLIYFIFHVYRYYVMSLLHEHILLPTLTHSPHRQKPAHNYHKPIDK